MHGKNVVICASVSFYEKVLEWRDKLESSGYNVLKYPKVIDDEDFAESYSDEFLEHYEAITKCDNLLVLNYEKKGISGYIGPGVFAEIAFALGLDQGIDVYYLNPISKEKLPYQDELELWEDLDWIKKFEEEYLSY